MTLQAAVNFKEYFRCYVVGQEDVRIMPYDPRQPHDLRYVTGSAGVSTPALLARVEKDALTLCRALGYDLNTVEFAVEDGSSVCDRLHEPGAGCGLTTRWAQENFRVDRGCKVARAGDQEGANEPSRRCMRFTGRSFCRGWRRVDTSEPASGKKVRRRRQLGRSQPGTLTSRQGGRGGVSRYVVTHLRARATEVRCGRRSRLGIEEEYQTVDPETRDLRSHISTDMLAQGKIRLEERVKAEMHQSVIEVGTRVCHSIVEHAREDLYDLRRNLIRLAEENGLMLVAGATHPFADWRDQEIYPDPRYDKVVEDLQLVARSNLIFGLHVHVGIEDKDAAIRVMNSLRYFLPHILALSTNSPFWMGMETGYKSYRAKVFEHFPRTNLPDSFASYSEFEDYVNLLIKTNSIDNAKKIWWDMCGRTRTSTRWRCGSAIFRCGPRSPLRLRR